MVCVLLREHRFDTVFANALRRFRAQSMNPLQIGKSLVYFSHADPDPPFVGVPVCWSTVKEFFRAHAREFVEHMIATPA